MKETKKTLIFVKNDLLLDEKELRELKKRVSGLSLTIPSFISIDGILGEELLVTLPDESILNDSLPENPRLVAEYAFEKLQNGYSLIYFEDILLHNKFKLIL